MQKLILFYCLFIISIAAFAVEDTGNFRDRDGDGVRDKKDRCPDVFGLKEFDGCPDSDLDGVEDALDFCPNVFGLKQFKGCPDTDGDGFSDKEDLCPELFGLEQFNGCPDSDNDGVMESKDDCPNTPGLIENKGCPIVDADADGVPDDKDKCPDIAGSINNEGCLEVSIAVLDKLNKIVSQIDFNSGKSTLNANAKEQLKILKAWLDNYPNEYWQINGFTDSSGNDAQNLKLSEKRAANVRQYLLDLGMDVEKVNAKGFGEQNPVDTNKTQKGRAKNRRVEIALMPPK